jgi:hypothetical protein
VSILRAIFAIPLIALFLIGPLIESAAHAKGAGCIIVQCCDRGPEETLVSKTEVSKTDPSTRMEASAGDDLAMKGTCALMACQAAALVGVPAMVHPLTFQTSSWVQVDLSPLSHGPSALDRPPNS